MNSTASNSFPTGRLYKSRKSRPCDSCRRRKVACDMPHGPPCRRCAHKDQQCTFEEGPGPRKRTKIAHLFEHNIQAVELNTHYNGLSSELPYDRTTEESGWFESLPTLQPAAEFTGQDTYHSVAITSPQSTTSGMNQSAVTQSSPRSNLSLPDCSTTIAPTDNQPPMQLGSTKLDSLESIPGAFSFYIGPTGTSDIHVLTHQPYDAQNVSLPNVNGLRYRIMSTPSQKKDAKDFTPPTVFGITDHALLTKAEPKLGPDRIEDAWSQLWDMMDPTAAWHLIQLYARYVDPYYPIVSKSQMPSDPSQLQYMSLALLTSICATALPFIMYDETLYTLLLHPPESGQLYELCWLCISKELHAPSLVTLQACLLLLQRLPTNMYLSDTAFSWSLMSTALAIAQTIGIHRDPMDWITVPAWERKLRRRLWWGLFVMEKWISLAR
ncbi:uncharacterized protein N7483_006354 [Penicillium malachiteum]|uniref:uncharacterized protein n=1 Tax=Penicillium malachiteum TaxID=1324776 RepID=UPI0025481DA8|nr:uncharacterized protein N7483_006354 [Penicillium malachiteum]KAJ5724997.1 hypothetical protein N7483_006354 [Penicillium malachiteum]